MYFEIYKDSSNQWHWRLRASNHEIIASGESYHNKKDCLHAIKLVKSTSKSAAKEIYKRAATAALFCLRCFAK